MKGELAAMEICCSESRKGEWGMVISHPISLVGLGETAGGNRVGINQVFGKKRDGFGQLVCRYLSQLSPASGPLGPVRLHCCETAKTAIKGIFFKVFQLGLALDRAPIHFSIRWGRVYYAVLCPPTTDIFPR